MEILILLFCCLNHIGFDKENFLGMPKIYICYPTKIYLLLEF